MSVFGDGKSEQPNRLGFADRETLPPGGGYSVYNFETKEAGIGIPNVLMTVKSTPSPVSLYCNPSWITAGDSSHRIAGPFNSIWSFEGTSHVGSVYLAANDPVTRRPDARKYGTPAYNSYTPSYNCTVINYDTDKPAHYTLSATFNFHDVRLVAAEQEAMSNIYDKVCRGRTKATEAALAKGAKGGGVKDNGLEGLPCGQWVNIDGLNGKSPFTDFCTVASSACNRDGHLTQLNMNGWNLGGIFPFEELRKLSALTELDLGNNPDMGGQLTAMFNAIATLKHLMAVEVGGNAAMAVTSDLVKDSSLCIAVTGGLRVLNMEGLGMSAIQIPPCLISQGSTLEELRLGNNGIGGVIPDVPEASSQLQYLSLRGNRLEGTIPATVGLAPSLLTLDVTGNSISGRIPPTLGQSGILRYLHLGYNNLTGAIPSSLGLHGSLEALDVRNNQLSALPDSWYTGANILMSRAPLAYLRLANNKFGSGFPSALSKLPRLAFLSMEGNKFSGELPDVKGGFSQLRHFDGSSNSLSGVIPQSWSGSGIIRLHPTEAALISQATGSGSSAEAAAASLKAATFQQVFNVSGNQLTGSVPLWLYGDNVPEWTTGGVDLSSNRLSLDCGRPLPLQLLYLTHRRACPQLPPPQALAAATAAAESNKGVDAGVGKAPAISPNAAPAVVEAATPPLPLPQGFATAPLSGEQVKDTLQAASPDSAAIVAEAAEEGTALPQGQPLQGSSRGLHRYAKAIICLGVIAVVGLAATLALLFHPGRGHHQGFLDRFLDRFRQTRPSGFADFDDAEVGYGIHHTALAHHTRGEGAGGNVQMGLTRHSDPYDDDCNEDSPFGHQASSERDYDLPPK